MDALKALVERKQKQRTIVVNNNNGSPCSSSPDEKKKRKKFLTASQRRQLIIAQEREENEKQRQQLQCEELQQQRGGVGKGKKRKRKKGKKCDNDGESDDDEESADLTTLLTTKKYHVSGDGRGEGGKKGFSAEDQADDHIIDDDGKKRSHPKSFYTDVDKYNDDNNHDTDVSKERQKTSLGRTNDDDDNNILEKLRKLTPMEVTNKLRSYGLPIRLFGEQTISITKTKTSQQQHDDTSRLQRLYIAIKGREDAMLGASEKDEFLLDSANRTRNVFLEKEDEKDVVAEAAATTATKTTTTTTQSQTETQLNKDDNDSNHNDDKPKRIYRYFKNLLRQWEEDLNNRPESIKRTMAGKNETKTYKQCKDYIRPLFQLCKRHCRRSLGDGGDGEFDESLQNHLLKIVLYCEQGEFVKAHDAYLDVAIGRAAWPIGVTMVGIHARSGRAKIESANVAHVMNSELQRKYLTSVKRLMSYAQRKRVDVDPSKKVLNL